MLSFKHYYKYQQQDQQVLNWHLQWPESSIKFPFSIIQWLLSKRVTRVDSDRNRVRQRQSQWKYFFRDYLVIPKANIKSLLIRSLVRSRSTAPPPPLSLTTSVKTGRLTHTHLSLYIVKQSFRWKETKGSRNRLMAVHQDHYRCSKSVASISENSIYAELIFLLLIFIIFLTMQIIR